MPTIQLMPYVGTNHPTPLAPLAIFKINVTMNTKKVLRQQHPTEPFKTVAVIT